MRLADVMWWLMKTKPLPRLRALQLLLEPIERDEVMPCLYQLDPSDYANPVPTDSMFGFPTARERREHDELFGPSSFASEEWLERDFRSRWFPPRSLDDQPEPGGPALVQRLMQSWSTPPRRPGRPDALDDRSSYAALAIPIHRAFAWWGYGTVSAAPATVQAPAFEDLRGRPKGSQWSDAERAVLLAEFERRIRCNASQSSVCKQLGDELGMSRPSIETQIKKARAVSTSFMPSPTTFPARSRIR